VSQSNWKRPLINQAEREVLTYLDEVRSAADPDLWQEVSAKLNDCLIVYRRHLERLAKVRFSDERTRVIDGMAFTHAFAEVFGEPDETDVN
jgi:hypothetical protein